MDTRYTDLDLTQMTKMLFSAPQNRLEFLMNFCEYGDVVRSKGAGGNRYFVNDPEIIHHVLVKNASNYTKLGTSLMRVVDVLQMGQLSSHGEAWQRSRKEMQPHFYHQHLASVFPIINHYTDEMLDSWQPIADTTKTLNIMEEMCAVVLKISTATLFGQTVPGDVKTTIKRFRFGNRYMATHKNLWPYKPTLTNLRYQYTRALIRRLSRQLIQAPEHNEFPDHIPLMTPILLEGNESPEEIQRRAGEACNYLLAGHDTTAGALNWAFYLLGQDPTILKILTEQSRALLATQEHNLDNYKDVDLAYRVIQEALRWYPPVWSLERIALGPDQFGPMDVPTNSYVFMSQYTIHRHPNYWEFPNQFYPDHFLPKYTKNRPKCAYIPFGMGPRVCIGQHFAMMIASTVLSKVVNRYHFQLDERQNIDVEPLITLKPKPDVKIRIQSLD